MRYIIFFCLFCPAFLTGCAKNIPDLDFENLRLRSRIFIEASAPTIPDWVLPGPTCVFTTNHLLSKVFVSGQSSLKVAERLALREIGPQSSLAINRWIMHTTRISNLGPDPSWCSNNARVVARYWEKWRDEESGERFFTLYLQLAFVRSQLVEALTKKAQHLSPALKALFDR